MQSVQRNLVENDMPPARKSGKESSVAPALSGEISGGKGHKEEQAAAADAMYAAFVRLFGSGCF
jgi:hypothetical protein